MKYIATHYHKAIAQDTLLSETNKSMYNQFLGYTKKFNTNF